MLSINYLSNFLGEKQINIDNSYYNRINKFERNKNTDLTYIVENNLKNKFNLDLPQSFNLLFNKSIIDFYYDNKKYKNKSLIFTFINSILSIIDETFNLYDLIDKENIIKDFITLIDNDLFQKDLYNKFNYTKNRKFNKTDIQSVLKNALQFKYCDKFYLLKEYICDYLGINIYIIKLNNDVIDFLNCKYYLTKYYNNNYNKYIPNFIIIDDNEIYKPVLKYNKELLSNTSSLMYSNNKDIIDNLWKYLSIDEIYNNNIKLKEEENNEKNKDNDKSNDDEQSNDEQSNDEQSNDEQSIDKESNEQSNEQSNDKESKESKIKKSKYNIELLNNLKIDSLKKLCTDNNILLQKKSEKTNKIINKLKNELINDLLKI
jgi:hypothetical protein